MFFSSHVANLQHRKVTKKVLKPCIDDMKMLDVDSCSCDSNLGPRSNQKDQCQAPRVFQWWGGDCKPSFGNWSCQRFWTSLLVYQWQRIEWHKDERTHKKVPIQLWKLQLSLIQDSKPWCLFWTNAQGLPSKQKSWSSRKHPVLVKMMFLFQWKRSKRRD